MCINDKHFGYSFAFDASTVWNNLRDEDPFFPNSPVSEKDKISSVQKGFPTLAYNLSSVYVVLDLAMAIE